MTCSHWPSGLTDGCLLDSSCPICITPFNAIFAEAEMAIAMESPAHPIDEQGIVKLHQTCGHVFCRKELSLSSLFSA